MGRLGSWWGVAGVCALLIFAIARLSTVSLEALAFELTWIHWSVFAINIVFMAYYEGYKGFQKSYSPRVAARARYIKDNPVPRHALLAPLFCMGYFYTTKRRLISAYVLTVTIIVLIIVFHQLSQPWRGLLDAGVVVGLSWGTLSILWCAWLVRGQQPVPWSAEIPTSSNEEA